MRFPLRLSAALLNTRIANLFAGRDLVSPILRLSPAAERGDRLSWIEPRACIERVTDSSAPVVWLSGAEPLLHPEIGRVCGLLTDAKRHVFLHTDGYQLRQRIHEFRPDPRLFLTVQFFGREETHNRVTDRTDAFHRTLEGIRAAKLSGFLIAAHFTVERDTDSCDVGQMIEFLDGKDVDGFIVSSGGKRCTAEEAKAVAESIEDALAMIRCGRWERFSRLLEESYQHPVYGHAAREVAPSSASALEEGD